MLKRILLDVALAMVVVTCCGVFGCVAAPMPVENAQLVFEPDVKGMYRFNGSVLDVKVHSTEPSTIYWEVQNARFRNKDGSFEMVQPEAMSEHFTAPTGIARNEVSIPARSILRPLLYDITVSAFLESDERMQLVTETRSVCIKD